MIILVDKVLCFVLNVRVEVKTVLSDVVFITLNSPLHKLRPLGKLISIVSKKDRSIGGWELKCRQEE